ncbi:MAG: HAMP domain-containing histidine kinase [Desulfobacterales bacterium]|nr:HAMP domain-containing histidine kinase [Desulfobacterales bacterium]
MEMTNRQAINAGFWCIILFFPLWMPFDWLANPEHKWRIFVLRLAVMIYTFVVRFWIHKIRESQLIWLTGVTGILAAAALSAICVITGEGFSSPNYAGIFPIILGICVVGAFNWMQLVTVIVIILLQHFTMLCMLPWDLRDLYINAFFLGGTAALGMALAGYIFRLKSAEWQAIEANKYCLRVFGHDVKNRLNASFLFIEKLRMNSTDEEAIHHLDQTLNDINRMTGNLINVFSINKIYLNKVNIDIRKLAKKISESWTPVAKIKNMDFDVLINKNPSGYWDIEYMQLVWDNLLSNAFQNTANGGIIKVVISEQNGFTTLSFINSGVIIPEDQRALLFEKYFAEEKHSPYHKGLGLHYSRMMCRLHDGNIEYRVVKEGLNEFKASLPISA